MNRKKLLSTVGIFAIILSATLVCTFYALSANAAITDDINTKARLNGVRQCYKNTSQGIVTPISQSKIANGRIVENIARNGDKIILTAGANGGTSESCRSAFNTIRGGRAISDITAMGYDGVGNGQDSAEGCFHYSFNYVSDNNTRTGRSNKVCCSLTGSGNNQTIIKNSCQAKSENTSSVKLELSIGVNSIIITNPNPKSAFTDNHGTAHTAEPSEIANILVDFNSGSMKWSDFVSRLDSYKETIQRNSRTFTSPNSSSNVTESNDIYDSYAANTRSVYDSSLRALRTLTGNGTATFPKFTEKEAHDLLRYYFDKEFDGTNASLGKGSCKSELDPSWTYAARLDGQWCEINGVETVQGTFHIVDTSTYSNLKKASFADIVKALMEINYDDESFEGEEPGDIDNENQNTGSSDGSSSDDNGTKACFENASALGWILCPVAQALGKALDTLYENVVETFLEVDAAENYTTNGEIHDGWKTFRDFANIIFAIMLILVILSQITGFGISNYGIKKMLPTLIMIVVLVNISFFLCQIAIDISNILGVALKEFFEKLSANGLASFQTTGRSFVGGLLSAVGITGVGIATGAVAAANASFIATAVLANLPAVIITLIVILISLFFFFLLLGVRQAGILIAVILSPVAVICYALPNTKSLFSKWRKLFVGLLMVYPICGAMMGATGFVSNLMLMSQNSGFFYNLVAALLQVVPFFMIPSLVKSSLNVMGSLGTRLPQFGQRISSFAGRQVKDSERLQDRQKRAEGDLAKIRYDRLMRKAGGDISRLSAGERRRLSRYGSRYRKQELEDAESMFTGANASEEVIANDIATMQRKYADKEITDEMNSILNRNDSSINPNDVDSLGLAFDEAVTRAMANPEDQRLQTRANALGALLQTKDDKGRQKIKEAMDKHLFDSQGNAITATNSSLRNITERLTQNDKWMGKTKTGDEGFFQQLNDVAAIGAAQKSQAAYAAQTASKTKADNAPDMADTALDTYRQFIGADGDHVAQNNLANATGFETSGNVDALHAAADAYTRALSDDRISSRFKASQIEDINRIREASYNAKVRQYANDNHMTDYAAALTAYQNDHGKFQVLGAGEKLKAAPLVKVAPPKGWTDTGTWVGGSMGLGSSPNKAQQAAFNEWAKDSARIDIHNERNK